MDKKAKQLVLDYIKENIFGGIHIEDIFITWSCYILGNRKYLLGWGSTDHYFEVTYNRNSDEWYIDVYKKVDNKCT